MSGSRGYWLAFAICAVAATIPLLVTPVLPAADLPEHMAQVAIWKHFDDACHGFADLYELHLARPYLLGYAIARAIALIVSVETAFKVTVWLSIVLLPLAIRFLLTRGGGDPWLSLLGFLFAYGYAFYWGFLNFALAIPIALVYLALVFRGRLTTITIVGIIVYAAHALMFVYCAIATIAVAIARRQWRLMLTIVPGALLFAVFALETQRAEADARVPTELGFVPGRIGDLASLLFANAFEPLGIVLLIGIIAAIVIARPRPTRDAARWTLLAISVLIYFCAPFGAYGSAYLYPRFAVMAAIAALLVLGAPRGPVKVSRALILLLIVGWMGILTMRFHRFAGEVSEFEQLLPHIPANRRVAQLNVDPFSEHVPGPVFWHYGALYQVRKGGLSAWSFANYYPQIVRYRRGMEPRLTSRTTPVSGMDWQGLLQYDYVLLRGDDPRRRVFRPATISLTFTARSGRWWLFATPRARMPQRDCAPINE